MAPMLMIRSNKSTIMLRWMVGTSKSMVKAMESRSTSTTTSLMVLAGKSSTHTSRAATLYSVTKKLVDSRLARKQAEDDVKLLANRIALLKMEE
jgi:hypothetical protein